MRGGGVVCNIHDTGSSGVCFIGDPDAARDLLLSTVKQNDFDRMDRTVGPKSTYYPSSGIVEGCQIRGIGHTERQSAGVTMEMAMKVTVRDTSVE